MSRDIPKGHARADEVFYVLSGRCGRHGGADAALSVEAAALPGLVVGINTFLPLAPVTAA
ncbi:hypothetical protein [Streptomyces nigrescens]